MARRRSFEDMNCSIARSLDVIGEWWTLLIVREAFRGVRRFDVFADRLGIASNILTARLRRLVEHDVLAERVYQERPLRVEYRLTPKGRELFPVLLALLQWGDRWYAQDGPPVALEHIPCGHRTRAVMVCDHCGERIDARQTRALPGRGAAEDAPSLVPSA
ncbi:MAG TPA: helix-turn-helix domain-containing protein [Candidatus Sulfotelmatobacter sp.]|nr:helix-turn-helix domain-containing protein [Candidatus Sulfotelmatobacter sp.]